MQGDIVGVFDSAGALVVEYKYDAWGKSLSVTGNLADTLGKRNPFRYRGYVYDDETGLYYLRSRYYNPVIGRFVNADGVIIPGLLLAHSFAYCSNNPTRRIDDSGHAWCDGIVNLWNKATNFVKECFQAQAKADIISANQKVYAANKVVSGTKSILSGAKESVSNWWTNTAKPLVKQAKQTVKTVWNKVTTYAKDALQAQQQADIISAQMTYNAACNVGNWVADNWKDVVDWTGIVYTGVVLAVNKAAEAGIIVIAPWVGVAMTVADFAFWIYSIGDKLEWW